jgi:hypothetical protein
MENLSFNTLIATLAAHGLNITIKRQRLAECVKKKHNPTLCCLQETYFSYEDR